jgi:gamma-glutamylcyclotransferase (GGCT)/AIG2-like uncharacterized protein YtfP
MIPVFVYGTLKSGYGNNILLRYSDHIDDAILNNYTMWYSATKGSFPVIYNKMGHIVKGEVYKVDSHTLSLLDQLEANGQMYDRKIATVKLSNGKKMKVYVYVGISNFWDNFADLIPVGKKVHDWQK